MSRKAIYDEDLLRQYIDPERIEKTPEGFTSKTITRIQIETQSVKTYYRFRMERMVPVISTVVVIGLIIAAVLIRGSKTDSFGMSLIKHFQNIEFNLPQIKLNEFFSFNLPEWSVYVFIGIVVLSLFDRVLSVLFNRH